VQRILLTGMSGAGKSSVVRELGARGHKAVDTDDGWCEVLPDGRQRWREAAVQELLETEDAEVLFVAGCEENQVRFHPQFDLVILLTAPLGVLVHRLDTRTTNAFGRAPEERRRFLQDVATVEPLLRGVADHTVDTTAPLEDVVDTVLGLLDTSRARD
jgi:shikimate kinase